MKNRKSLGQHWLKDRAILDDIADLATPAPLCLEIGPGLGTLTSSLLRNFDEVVAVELDDNLAKNLPKSFPGKNLTVINANFLDFDLKSIKKPYAVAANIPYYITSPIIEKLLNAENLPKRIVLLIQKEVAERIVALNGKNSMLSLVTENRASVTMKFIVGAEYFTPPPKVDSAVIVLTPHKESRVSEYVLKVAALGFSSPRKKLANNLSLYFTDNSIEDAFSQLNFNQNARPSDLSLADWQALSKILIAR